MLHVYSDYIDFIGYFCMQTISNVGQMHKAAKAGLKDVKSELAAGGCE
jgi:hypothetical protein